MKKIISHLPPRHLDDFLAISILKNISTTSIIEYINPHKIPKNYYLDKENILVDLGGIHSPKFNNFDHHQDINLPCSLGLVLKKFYGIKVIQSPILNIIDKIDRFGFYQAKKILLENNIDLKTNREIEYKRRVILSADLMKHGRFIGEFLINNLSIHDYEIFIKKLYSDLDNLHALDEPKLIIMKEDEDFQSKIKDVKVYEVLGFKIAFLNDCLYSNINELFNKTNADILIQKNGMDLNQTIILKNTKSPNNVKINLDNIFRKYKKIFLHATGFLAVIDVPLHYFNIDDLKIVFDQN